MATEHRSSQAPCPCGVLYRSRSLCDIYAHILCRPVCASVLSSKNKYICDDLVSSYVDARPRRNDNMTNGMSARPAPRRTRSDNHRALGGIASIARVGSDAPLWVKYVSDSVCTFTLSAGLRRQGRAPPPPPSRRHSAHSAATPGYGISLPYDPTTPLINKVLAHISHDDHDSCDPTEPHSASTPAVCS